MSGSVHRGSARWDDYGQMFLNKLCVSSFPIGSEIMPEHQDIPAYDDVPWKHVWLQKDRQFTRYNYQRNNHILIVWSLAVTLTLKIANQIFCMTPWLMTIHNHTKFGYERLSCSRDTDQKMFIGSKTNNENLPKWPALLCCHPQREFSPWNQHLAIYTKWENVNNNTQKKQDSSPQCWFSDTLHQTFQAKKMNWTNANTKSINN